jgi:hypothetical protein
MCTQRWYGRTELPSYARECEVVPKVPWVDLREHGDVVCEMLAQGLRLAYRLNQALLLRSFN